LQEGDARRLRTYGTPAPLKEGCEEVDADKRDVACGRYRFVLLRGSDAHEDTDVKHRETHGDRGPEQRFATSEGVGGEDQEQAAHDHLDDAVDAGCEETGLGAVETKVGEDLRSIYISLVADISRGGISESRTVVAKESVS
jgi:hypothetical protein